ncbi:MAG: hypothetical protein LH609_02940 [Rudanella sp.]|nr:hypothetical protein [Rudanella sp.]
MCGIFGTLNQFIDHPAQVLGDLHHRGPDSHGCLTTGPLSLLHTRLAIQELGTGGNQPMQRGRWVLAFNGEIYNHHELRYKFNLCCRSGSDAETLLHLWERLGVAMLPLLDGMFAFVLFDTVSQQLWLARDQFGQKPLYLWQSGNKLVFSSELRALQRHQPLAIKHSALSQFCQLGYFLPDQTPYQNVRQVRPGHVLCIEAQTLTQTETCWVPEKVSVRPPIPDTDILKSLERILTRTVHQQLDTTDR